tara:strand:+ start:630 stop:908 length:279 start_codon:yes stop_codon:yes gene_type:complete
MSREMIKDDSQEVFVIEQQTTTFPITGNTIQTVTVKLGDTTFELTKHSNSDSADLNIHRIGGTEVTIFSQKVSKQQTKLSCGSFWTVIEKVD